jgi:hypothetical protein
MQNEKVNKARKKSKEAGINFFIIKISLKQN